MLAHVRANVDMKLRYQMISLATKFRKGFAKFIILIALLKKCLGQKFIASVKIKASNGAKVCNLARCSSKSGELRNIYSLRYRKRNITI